MVIENNEKNEKDNSPVGINYVEFVYRCFAFASDQEH